jgi:thymidylate kinase
MIIELFGVPGSGKTSLAAAVADKVRFVSRHEIVDQWRQRPLLGKAGELVKSHLQLSQMWAVLRFARAARLTRAESLGRLSRLVAKSRRLRSVGEPVLLDQGLMQELWSVLYASGRTQIDPALVAPLIKALYDPSDTCVVYVTIDAATAAQRVSGRSKGNSRLDRKDPGEIADELTSASELPDRLIEGARLAGISVRTVDGSLPCSVNADAVLAAAAR